MTRSSGASPRCSSAASSTWPTSPTPGMPLTSVRCPTVSCLRGCGGSRGERRRRPRRRPGRAPRRVCVEWVEAGLRVRCARGDRADRRCLPRGARRPGARAGAVGDRAGQHRLCPAAGRLGARARDHRAGRDARARPKDRGCRRRARLPGPRLCPGAGGSAGHLRARAVGGRRGARRRWPARHPVRGVPLERRRRRGRCRAQVRRPPRRRGHPGTGPRRLPSRLRRRAAGADPGRSAT